MDLNNWTDEQIAQGKKSFMHTAKHMMPEFAVDERNKEVINDLFYYFHKLEGGKLDPRKGLWLEGTLGTGKSELMNIFSAYLRRYWNGSGFKVYNCQTISKEYQNQKKDEDALDRYTSNREGYRPYHRTHMCFDELGREPKHTTNFGNKINVMEHILAVRYNFWQSEGLITYVTTNLKAHEVEGMYEDYIRDRRAEMFNIIAMTGESRRI